MLGSISFVNPLTNLKFKVVYCVFEAAPNEGAASKLTVYVDLFLNQQALDANKPLCQREYVIPLLTNKPGDVAVVTGFETLIQNVLAVAVAVDGQFTLGS